MNSPTVRLAAVGDIMLGDMPACYGFGVMSTIDQGVSENYPWQGVRARLSQSDLRFGNLEAVLSDIGRNRLWLPSLYMRGRPEYIEHVRNAGFDVLSVANNHMMQHGKGAFRDTVERLEQAAIVPVGQIDADTSGPRASVMNVKGLQLGFLGTSMRPEEYRPHDVAYSIADEDTIVAAIKALRDRVDHVVLSVHWGDEYIRRPSGDQVTMAKHFIDAGASVVLGHHPHVLQGIQRYNGGVIAYSLGNFVFDMWMPDTRQSIICEIFLSKNCVEDVQYAAIELDEHYQPCVLTGDRAERFGRDLDSLNRLCQSEVSDDEYQREVRENFSAYRESVLAHYRRSLRKYNPFYFLQLCLLIVIRRFTNLHI